jgi:DNA-3-methyladenine glycosylase II
MRQLRNHKRPACGFCGHDNKATHKRAACGYDVMTYTPQLIQKARRHLFRRDPILKRTMQSVGPCTLQPTGVSFAILVRAIISQLISTKAALTIHSRLEAALPDKQVTPATILAVSAETLRGVGLSGNKARALHDLAGRIARGELPLDQMADMTDDEVVGHLLPVHGIGKWTAEMFLIFALGRLDVLPVDDLGLRAAVRDLYALPDLPDRGSLRELAEPWRPYRSIATWYCWRSRSATPQSE